MKKIIGWTMLCAPVPAMIVYGLCDSGLYAVMAAIGFFVVGLLAATVWLIACLLLIDF